MSGAAQEYLEAHPDRIDFDPGWEGVEGDLAPKTHIKTIRRWQRLFREGRWSADGVPPEDESDVDNLDEDKADEASEADELPRKMRPNANSTESTESSKSSSSTGSTSGDIPSLFHAQRTASHTWMVPTVLVEN